MRHERRVLLHPIDEHESPGVLQLALHGEQIEEPHEVARFQPRAGFRLEGLQIARQHRVDERPIQLDVAVPEQRDQVVLPRALQRVLEVDHHLVPIREHHDVAALVVAVREPARRVGELARDAREMPPQRLQLRFRGSGAARQQPVLDEMLELPVVQVVVERAGPGDASRIRIALRMRA